MEGKTPFERIIDGSTQRKEVARSLLQETFDNRSTSYSEYEIPKGPEDLELIAITESIVDKIVAHYGGDPKPLPTDRIHLLKPGSVNEVSNGQIALGVHSPLGHTVGIEKSESQALFASLLAHELFHLKVPKAARAAVYGDDVHLYRTGITMIDRKDPNAEPGQEKAYFTQMEEAIVAKCVQKFQKELYQDSRFAEEARALRQMKDWVGAFLRKNGKEEQTIDLFEKELKHVANIQEKVQEVMVFSTDENKRQAYAAGMFEALSQDNKIEEFERYREREMLDKVINEVMLKSNGKFTDQEEIFTEFAKAHFTGIYLPIARIVEGALGRGSFRRLAEEFSIEPPIDNE